MFIFEFIRCLTCFTARCVYILIIAHIAIFYMYLLNTCHCVRLTCKNKRQLTYLLTFCLSHVPIIQPQQRRTAGLLLSAVRAGNISRQRRAPSSNCAAARRSVAKAGSATATIKQLFVSYL